MTTAELVANSNEKSRDVVTPADQAGHAPLYDEREASELRNHWQSIQAGFGDDPRASVEKADQLVASAITRLAEIFANERGNLETEWSRGGEASTEDLSRHSEWRPPTR
jgi:hypothetical protein